MADKLKVTLTRSKIGTLPKQRATVAALGLNKTGSANVLPDNPAVRGMIRKVTHLVSVEEQ
ncbi:MAG: 50S ribosomal protein L30 [Clostridiales bacterium]|jgi:large subunit ribosomal protein L30|nr:50S ribosomal protein L30 [Clostridiales bacterium]